MRRAIKKIMGVYYFGGIHHDLQQAPAFLVDCWKAQQYPRPNTVSLFNLTSPRLLFLAFYCDQSFGQPMTENSLFIQSTLKSVSVLKFRNKWHQGKMKIHNIITAFSTAKAQHYPQQLCCALHGFHRTGGTSLTSSIYTQTIKQTQMIKTSTSQAFFFLLHKTIT